MTKIAFVIGRYQPPHDGHRDLCEELLRLSKETGVHPVILLGSCNSDADTEKNPFNPEQREEMFLRMFPNLIRSSSQGKGIPNFVHHHDRKKQPGEPWPLAQTITEFAAKHGLEPDGAVVLYGRKEEDVKGGVHHLDHLREAGFELREVSGGIFSGKSGTFIRNELGSATQNFEGALDPRVLEYIHQLFAISVLTGQRVRDIDARAPHDEKMSAIAGEFLERQPPLQLQLDGYAKTPEQLVPAEYRQEKAESSKGKKVVVLGAAGRSGTSTAIELSNMLGDRDTLVLADQKPPEGQSDDLKYAFMHDAGKPVKLVYAGQDGIQEAISNADLIVMAASAPYQLGIDRYKNFPQNLAIAMYYGNIILKEAPDAKMIVVSNPVEGLAMSFADMGVPRENIFGKTGIDTARLRYYTAEKIWENKAGELKSDGFTFHDLIDGLKLQGGKFCMAGLHNGETMIPCIDLDIKPLGRKLLDLIGLEDLLKVVDHTRNVGPLCSSQAGVHPFVGSSLQTAELAGALLFGGGNVNAMVPVGNDWLSRVSGMDAGGIKFPVFSGSVRVAGGSGSEPSLPLFVNDPRLEEIMGDNFGRKKVVERLLRLQKDIDQFHGR